MQLDACRRDLKVLTWPIRVEAVVEDGRTWFDSDIPSITFSFFMESITRHDLNRRDHNTDAPTNKVGQP